MVGHRLDQQVELARLRIFPRAERPELRVRRVQRVRLEQERMLEQVACGATRQRVFLQTLVDEVAERCGERLPVERGAGLLDII